MKKNKIIAFILSVLMLAACIPFTASANTTGTGTNYREGMTLVSMDTMLKKDLNDSGTVKAAGVSFTDINMIATEMDGNDPMTSKITNQNGHFVIGAEKGISYKVYNHSGITGGGSGYKQSKKIGTNTNLPLNATTKYTISFDIQPSAYSVARNDKKNFIGFMFTEADGTTITGSGDDTRWLGYGWTSWINGATHTALPQLKPVTSFDVSNTLYADSAAVDVAGMWKYTANDANDDGAITADEISNIEYTHFDMELDGYTMRIFVNGTKYAEWTMKEEQIAEIGDTLGLYLWSRWQDYGGGSALTEQFRMKDLVVKAGNVVGKQSISFDKANDDITMAAGQTNTLMSDAVSATWTSSDPTVASIDANGTITALKKGETTITVTAGGKTATCKVIVTLETAAISTLIASINAFTASVTPTDKPCGEAEGQPYVSMAVDKTLKDAIAAAEQGATTALTQADIDGIINTLNTAYEAYKAVLKFGEHTWNDGEITKQPTVDSTGEKTFTCTACGETKVETVKKLKPSDTTAPDTTANNAVSSETTSEKTDGGCGGSIAVGGIGFVALSLCGAVLVGKKKKDNE